MFASAIEKVRQFTKPLIVSTRYHDGTVDCGIGVFVILNDQGWIATAMHMFNAHVEHQKHTLEIAAHRAKVKALEDDKTLSPKQRAKQISRLATNPKWRTNISYWWAADGKNVNVWHGIAGADIAIGQLTPFAPSDCSLYPTIKNPQTMKAGTSLCRLGYPFHNVTATFDLAANVFSIPPSVFPIPEFPNEGIFTRVLTKPAGPENPLPIKFIETSSPGLRGQSGGPIFDQNGNIWGIQSDTAHLPLGFAPTLKLNGKDVVEHQFLNVGRGIHCEMLIEILKLKNVSYVTSAN